MEIEKIRNLNDTELTTQASQTAEQLFRLRFQKNLGNSDGIKKLQGLRRDIARFKTVARQRALGIDAPVKKAETAEAPKAAAKKSAAKKATVKAGAAKKASAKKAKKD
jgi:large subunit ribosomal protein L29